MCCHRLEVPKLVAADSVESRGDDRRVSIVEVVGKRGELLLVTKLYARPVALEAGQTVRDVTVTAVYSQ